VRLGLEGAFDATKATMIRAKAINPTKPGPLQLTGPIEDTGLAVISASTVSIAELGWWSQRCGLSFRPSGPKKKAKSTLNSSQPQSPSWRHHNQKSKISSQLDTDKQL